jgi:lipoteichoic acid synthase
MRKHNQIYNYILYITIFFFANIANTFFLTVSFLNRYIAPFRHTFLGNVNAFLGNFAVLFLLLMIIFSITNNVKKRMFIMLFVTLFLNFWIFLMGIFNLYFGTAFSRAAMVIFQNPAPGIAAGILLEVLLELITYYRIVVFLPFFALLYVYLASDRIILGNMNHTIKLKKFIIGFLSVSMIMIVTIFSYGRQFTSVLPIQSAKSTYAIQNLGVYPYYLGQLLGYKFDVNVRAVLDIKEDQDMFEAYQSYNKNQSSYVNYFNGKTYSNRLTLDQTINDLYIDPSLIQDSSLHGILEGKNLVLIHLESFNYFLLEVDQTNQRLSFLNNLLEQSFVFSEFYPNVGMGVSSDAELSVLTGLLPRGDETAFWEFNNTPYDLNSIVKYFNQQSYFTKAIHGDTEIFYNRRNVYNDMFEFDAFYALEDFIADGYDVSQGYMYDTINQKVHHSPWISDYHLADMIYEVGSDLLNQEQPFMMFPVAMMPHTPFDYDPYGYREDVYPEWVGKISHLTLKYINYVDYYDETFKRFFINEFNQNQTLEDTVYIFYSDHGAGLKNGDLSTLYGYELHMMENRRKLQETIAFIYVPGENLINYGDYSIKEGLVRGNQSMVRSQIDLYRTIIELFDLPVGGATYFGVHGMSDEPTFSIDNKLLDVITDSYIYSMRNRRNIFPEETVDETTFLYIRNFKLLNDLMLSKADFQVMIDKAIEQLGG